MSITDSVKVEFGKNAVLDKSTPEINTGTESVVRGTYIVKVGLSQEIASFYYNTDTEKRKNAYQTLNRILAEG